LKKQAALALFQLVNNLVKAPLQLYKIYQPPENRPSICMRAIFFAAAAIAKILPHDSVHLLS